MLKSSQLIKSKLFDKQNVEVIQFFMKGLDMKEVCMCQAMREIREDERREGRKEGHETTCRETVLRMLSRKKFSYEEIAELNAVSVEKVKEIAEQTK